MRIASGKGILRFAGEDGTTLGGRIPLLQERYADNAWAVLVASMCLKRTTRAQAEDAVTELLDRYPTAEAFRRADSGDVKALLRPLGLWRTRTEELFRLAERLSQHAAPETKAAVLEFHGVGEYVANSYAIFVLGDDSVEPVDEELRRSLAE